MINEIRSTASHYCVLCCTEGQWLSAIRHGASATHCMAVVQGRQMYAASLLSYSLPVFSDIAVLAWHRKFLVMAMAPCFAL